jgi:predicted Fe-S protein YdhL (DUF1289 family)
MSNPILSFTADDLLREITPANDRVGKFVADYLPVAQRAAARLGVEPEVLLGQWGLETGWGKSVVPGTHNLGNIKDFSGSGVQAKDNQTGSTDKYRRYGSPEVFADDFAGLVARRFRGAAGAGADAQRYFEGLQSSQTGAYAEDRDYVNKGVSAARMARSAMGKPAAEERATPGAVDKDRYIDIGGKPARSRGAFEAVNDTVIESANAVLGGVKAVGDFVSPGNALSRGAQALIDDGQAKQSDVVRDERARLQEDLELAETAGEEVTTVLGYMARNPVLTAAQMAGMLAVPGAAIKGARGAAMLLGGGAKAAAAAGAAAGVGAGAMLGGGDAAGTAYELVQNTPDDVIAKSAEAQELAAQGLTPAQIKHELGTRAARAASALPAMLGAAGGAIGAERILAAGGKAAGGAKRVLATGAIEGSTEGAEEAATQFSGQRAAQPYNPEIDPTKGVAAAGAQGAVMGAGTGAAVAALAPELPVVPPEVAAKAAEPNSPLSKAAASGATAQQNLQTAQQQNLQTAQARLADLDRKASGTPGEAVTLPDGSRRETQGAPGLFLTDAERSEREKLRAMLAPAQTAEQQAQAEQQAAQAAAANDVATVDAGLQAARERIRTGSLFDVLRAEGSPYSASKIASDLAIAGSKNTPIHTREQALGRIQGALQWAEDSVGRPGLGAAQELNLPVPETRESEASTAEPIPADMAAAAASVPDFQQTAVDKVRARAARRDLGPQDAELVERFVRQPFGLTAAERVRAQALLNGDPSVSADRTQNENGRTQNENGFGVAVAGQLSPGKHAQVSENAELSTAQPVAESLAPGRSAEGDGGVATTPAAVDRTSRRAHYDDLAELGFETIERNEDGSYTLRNARTKQSVPVRTAADAQLARAAIKARFDRAAARAARDPSPAQIEAENWRKGEKRQLNGVTVTIENERGSTRRSKPGAKVQWESTMVHHYGDIDGYIGADGDEVDVFVGQRPDSPRIFVVDQRNRDGKFDEHKVMFGFTSEQDARAGYLSNYEPGWTGLGAITEMSQAEFKAWLKGDLKKPASPGFGDNRATDDRSNSTVPGARPQDAGAGARPSDDGRGVAGGAAAGGRGGQSAGAGDRAGGVRDDHSASAPAQSAGRRGETDPGRAAPEEDTVEVRLSKDGPLTRIALMARAPSAKHRLLERIAERLGRRVRFYQARDAAGRADGFTKIDDPSTIYLAADSKVNPLQVLLHEFWHTVERTQPDVADIIKQTLRGRVGGKQWLTFRSYYNVDGIADEALFEELRADLAGLSMADPTFWADVFDEIEREQGEKAPGIIARILGLLEHLLDSMNAAIVAFRDQDGFETHAYVDDMKAVRAAYKQALKQYLQDSDTTQQAMGADILRAKKSAGRVAASPAREQNAAREEDDTAGRLGRDAGEDRGREAADLPRYGTPVAGAVSAVGRHYSDAKRTTLSGAAFGRGLKGAERARLEGLPAGSPLRQRISFYIDLGNGVRPESGVGAYAHEVRLDNLYDADSGKITGRDHNEFERKVIEAGYDGYMTRRFTTQQGAAVLLGKHDVPVKPIGQPPAAAAPREEPPQEIRYALSSREIDAIDVSKIPGATLRSGTLRFPAASRDAAAAEMGRIGGDAAAFDADDADITKSAERQSARHVQRAAELLEEIETPRRSAVAIMRDEIDAPTFDNLFELSRWFTRRNRRGAEDMGDAAVKRRMLDALYADTLLALTDPKSGVGWYDEKVRAALGIMAEAHPEIATDEQARFGFIALLAITSNQTRVNENFEIADALYSQWKRTGEFPVDVSAVRATKAQTEMSRSLAKLRELIDEHGWRKVRDFMVTKQRPAAIEKFTGYKVTGENADAEVYGATAFGPKLGSFFNNLYGNFDTVTMDRWWMRTVNRIRGSMLSLPNSFGALIDKLDAQIAADVDTLGVDAKAMRREIAAWKRLSDGDQADVLVALEQMPTVVEYAKKRHKHFAKSSGQGRSSFGERTAENYLAKNLDLALRGDEQAPRNGGDRLLMRDLVFKLQQRLKDAGIDMVIADIQAALWYYEKALVAKLRGKTTAQDNLFEDQDDGIAEDYETAARRVLARRGEPGPAERRAGAARRDAGAAERAAAGADRQVALFSAGRGDGGGRDPGRVDAAGEGAPADGRAAPLQGYSVSRGVGSAWGPDPRIAALAERYARDNGIDYRRQAEYVAVDEERAKRIADAYEAMAHAPRDARVKAAYADLIRQTRAQYDALVADGYEFTFFDAKSDPYAGNPWAAMRDLRDNRRMAVYGTYDGYGTDGITGAQVDGNPMLADTGLRWRDQDGAEHPVVANDLFRAVHDAFGHGLEGAGFRADGEENAWNAHVRLFTGDAVGAITTETRGQNSWLNFGEHGERNRTASLEDTVFAEQKTGLMPEWAWSEGRAESAPPDPDDDDGGMEDDFGTVKKSADRAPAWYSQLARALAQAPAKFDGAAAPMWVQWLKANAAKLGVKQDEITWSGIEDYLKLRGKDKLSRDELSQWVRENGVQVQEVVLGNGGLTPAEVQEVNELNDLYRRSEAGEDGVFDAGDFDRLQELEQHKQDGSLAQYERHTLPGGENYREVLLTLPTKEDAINEHRAFLARMRSKYPGSIVERGAAMSADERTQLDRLGAAANAQREAPTYRHKSHWDGEYPNVLAHIRVNDRTDADGKRVLFVEEIQSDWAQEGKKKGFAVPARQERIREINARLREIAKGDDEASAEDQAEWNRLTDEKQAMQRPGVPKAPFVGKTDAWVALAIKRVVKMAVDEGYDRVAFVTGEQSADRYDLSKQVKEITYEKTAKGYFLNVMTIDGRNALAKDMTIEEVEDHVGKDIVAKIVAGEGRDLSTVDPDLAGSKTLSGIDLKVGGEGMKAFYDEIVPQVVRDVLKKVGGGSVREVAFVMPNRDKGAVSGVDVMQWLGVPSDKMNAWWEEHAYERDELFERYRNRNLSDKPAMQPGFDITDKMREAASGGMAMFSAERKSGDDDGLRKFAKSLGDQVRAQGEFAQMLARQHEWVHNVGDVLLSTHTGKTYRLTGRTFSRVGKTKDNNWQPIYSYESGNPPPRGASPSEVEAWPHDYQRGTFTEKAILESKTLKSLVTPRFSSERVESAHAGWQTPSASSFDDMVYRMQDKHIDTKRVVDAVREADGALRDDLDVYLQEELFHGRAAKRTEDFVHKELQPLVEAMRERGLSLAELDEYLHARHAKEANAVIRERNPEMEDGGSGLTDADADAYFAELTADKREHLAAAAEKVDAILKRTRKLLVEYQLESRDKVRGWSQMFEHYVPLMRDEEGAPHSGNGTGQGFSIKGKEVKSRTGSKRRVVDILANIAMQRERVIVRGEKNRVGQALVGLAVASPSKDFWTVNDVPSQQVFNEKTGLVETRYDTQYKNNPNVVTAKFTEDDGTVREHAVVFNERDERALRMAGALKNLDASQLEGLLGLSATATRYFASVNTQYNPVFGIVNLIRDVQGAMVNLQSTELAGKQREIARGTLGAIRGIYGDARKARKGEEGASAWAALWEDFTKAGGQTGYRDIFATSADRAAAIEKALDPDAWADSKLGRIFTANGALKVPMAAAMRAARWLFDWLSDYNLAMENGVRLSAYKAALDAGMGRERAASLAKNLTVNFNRKGQVAQQAGALYAFFNASMQGTARLAGTLFEQAEPGKFKTTRLTPLGKKVVAGGVLLGATQALALAAAGFGEDDPPEWARERNLIVPLGGKKYLSIPLPLGLHVLPNIGRVTTEWALSGLKDTPKRALSLVTSFAEAFNPIGNAGMSIQTIAPTAIDPLVALTENKDWSGRPIYRESSNKATPGHALARDTATVWSRLLSEGINLASGGNKHVAGALSPTPDAIDYLIGQVTGGVGREISKVTQTATATVQGETLPLYKVPLVGRLIGDAKSQASEGSAFYANLERLNKIETEIKGLRKEGDATAANAIRLGNPEAYLITQANHAERAVQKLRREKREAVAAGAPREQVKAIEERITARMASLNRAVEKLRERE